MTKLKEALFRKYKETHPSSTMSSPSFKKYLENMDPSSKRSPKKRSATKRRSKSPKRRSKSPKKRSATKRSSPKRSKSPKKRSSPKRSKSPKARKSGARKSRSASRDLCPPAARTKCAGQEKLCNPLSGKCILPQTADAYGLQLDSRRMPRRSSEKTKRVSKEEKEAKEAYLAKAAQIIQASPIISAQSLPKASTVIGDAIKHQTQATPSTASVVNAVKREVSSLKVKLQTSGPANVVTEVRQSMNKASQDAANVSQVASQAAAIANNTAAQANAAINAAQQAQQAAAVNPTPKSIANVAAKDAQAAAAASTATAAATAANATSNLVSSLNRAVRNPSAQSMDALNAAIKNMYITGVPPEAASAIVAAASSAQATANDITKAVVRGGLSLPVAQLEKIPGVDVTKAQSDLKNFEKKIDSATGVQLNITDPKVAILISQTPQNLLNQLVYSNAIPPVVSPNVSNLPIAGLIKAAQDQVTSSGQVILRAISVDNQLIVPNREFTQSVVDAADEFFDCVENLENAVNAASIDPSPEKITLLKTVMNELYLATKAGALSLAGGLLVAALQVSTAYVPALIDAASENIPVMMQAVSAGVSANMPAIMSAPSLVPLLTPAIGYM